MSDHHPDVPDPIPGQIWRHRKTGHYYTITAADIELAGELRNVHTGGNLHVYVCLESGKEFARLTALWHIEHHSFELVERTIWCGTVDGAKMKEAKNG